MLMIKKGACTVVKCLHLKRMSIIESVADSHVGRGKQSLVI